jgi:hypothetical protein
MLCVNLSYMLCLAPIRTAVYDTVCKFIAMVCVMLCVNLSETLCVALCVSLSEMLCVTLCVNLSKC